jgi:AP endonuclease-2
LKFVKSETITEENESANAKLSPNETTIIDRINNVEKWGKIMASKSNPMCIHGDVAIEKTVNKPGPNKGKRFFTCPRPVGPGPENQCSFWEWK